MGMKPKVTVLMPVFNAQAYLKEAMDSILNQSYRDFEFLIVNDGSTDHSAAIINGYTDSRIRHITFGDNRGIIEALNVGLDLAMGDYIIRMDADDISLPTRVAEQVEFMDTNPMVGLCGTLVKTMGGKVMNQYMQPSRLQASLLLDCPLVHPSVVIRMSVLSAYQLRYDNNFKHVEDYQLWVEMSKHTKIAILPRILLEYRVSETQVSSKFRDIQDVNSNRIKQGLFEILLSRSLTQTEQHIVSRKSESVHFNMRQLIDFCEEVELKNSRYNQRHRTD